jgi:hypothetical protein
MINYACIKDGIVVNTLIFEDNNPELAESVKETFSYDELVTFDADLVVNVGYLYDGTDFYKEAGKKALRLNEVDPDKVLPNPNNFVREGTPPQE